MQSVVEKRPMPHLQLLKLSHMPDEILHRIAWLCDNEAARALAATSKRFNEIAGPYAWMVRTALAISLSCIY